MSGSSRVEPYRNGRGKYKRRGIMEFHFQTEICGREEEKTDYSCYSN